MVPEMCVSEVAHFGKAITQVSPIELITGQDGIRLSR